MREDRKMTKWIKTSSRGIRYREHPTRKHGIMPDKYYMYNYRIGKNLVQEALGWASEGMTQEEAETTRHDMKKAQRGAAHGL